VPSRANKDLPLHIACRYQASSTALELMLREYPITAVYETKFGKKALSILWEFRSTGAEDTPQFWEKVVVILSAVALSRLDSLHKKYCYDSSTRRSEVGKQISSEAFLLHASVSLGSRCCPIEVLQYLLERDPNQASRRDSTHKLPLHIALGPTSWSEATRRKYKPRERPFIALLLDAYPHAAHEYLAINSNRYPLHLALTSRHFWSEGVSHLVRAAPEVLLRPDPMTKLFPFQLAAIPVGDTSVDLSTIFCLLRNQPDILGFFPLTEGKKCASRCIIENIRKGVYVAKLGRFIESFFV